MIKGLFLGFAVLAVLWLAVWTMRGEQGKRGGWAPFDMREADPAPPEELPDPRRRRTQATRARRSR